MVMIYWLSTSVVSVLLLLSAYSYFFHAATIEGVRELGFPDHFRLQLGVLKVLAAVVLVMPWVPSQAKEWAYAGVALFIVTAIVAHTAHEDSWVLTVVNVALFALLVVSNLYFHKLPSS